MVPTRWLGGWGGAGGRWSSRSLLPPASPASCAAKDKALVSMWAPLKDPISRRQTLPLFQTPLWGTGGGSLGLEPDLVPQQASLPFGLGLGHPHERGKQGPRMGGCC